MIFIALQKFFFKMLAMDTASIYEKRYFVKYGVVFVRLRCKIRSSKSYSKKYKYEVGCFFDRFGWLGASRPKSRRTQLEPTLAATNPNYPTVDQGGWFLSSCLRTSLKNPDLRLGQPLFLTKLEGKNKGKKPQAVVRLKNLAKMMNTNFVSWKTRTEISIFLSWLKIWNFWCVLIFSLIGVEFFERTGVLEHRNLG